MPGSGAPAPLSQPSGTQPLYGLFCLSTSTQTAEVLAQCGFGFLVFDLEHTPNTMPQLAAQWLATCGTGTLPMVRVPAADAACIKPVLDMGFETIIVPGIRGRQDAQEAVRCAMYPPRGVRGIGGAVRATCWGQDTGYYARANDTVRVLALVETRAGLDELEAICAVDGLAGVFFGPSDLAADLGLLGQPGHPAVVSAVESAIRTVHGAGKLAGVAAAEPQVTRYREAGAGLIALGTDLAHLAQAGSALARRWKANATPADRGEGSIQ